MFFCLKTFVVPIVFNTDALRATLNIMFFLMRNMENPGKQKATALQYQLYFCFISVFNNPNLPYRGPREPR